MTLEEYTCGLFGCTVDELFSRSRLRRVVGARGVCMSVLKDFDLMSLRGIGKLYGKNHTTVRHSIRTVKDLYATDKSFRAMVDKVYDACHAMSITIDGSAPCYLDEDMKLYAELV